MTTILFDIINNSIYVVMAYLFSCVFLKSRVLNSLSSKSMIIIWIIADNAIVNGLSGYPLIKLIATVVLFSVFSFMLFSSLPVHIVTVQLIFVGLSVVSELVVMLGLTMVAGFRDLNTVQEASSYYVGGVLSQIIIFIVIIVLSRIMRKDDFGVLKTREWILIMVLPLFTICIVLGIFYAFNHGLSKLQINVLSCVVFGILILNLSQYYLVRDLARKESSIRESQIITERARTTNHLYDQLAFDRETQKAKDHDTIKLLTTAASMAQDAGNKELYSYLSENLDITESSMDVFDCGNAVINALINTKYYEARHKDIPINYSLEDLSGINLPNSDIVSIVANMLDNAIEASCKCDSERRYIRFKALLTGGLLCVSCENYYIGNLVMGGNGFKSDKDSDGHGYGLLNIESTANKYNGECSIDSDNNLFRISVIIPIPEK